MFQFHDNIIITSGIAHRALVKLFLGNISYSVQLEKFNYTEFITEHITSLRWRLCGHHDVIKWKHYRRNWPFVRGIHRSTMNSPHKGQWRGALMFSLICVWINEAGDLRRYRAHCDVIVMSWIWILYRRVWQIYTIHIKNKTQTHTHIYIIIVAENLRTTRDTFQSFGYCYYN